MSLKKRKRVIFVTAAILLLAAGAAIWLTYPSARDKVEEAVLTQALSSGQEDIPNIIFKMFSLTQGEEGMEAWRLKAEVASVRKDSGKIYVDAPTITYFTRPDNEEVKVRSALGMVDQGERNMDLWPDVVVLKDNSTLKTTKMSYHGADHTLYFPEKITVESDDILGKAAEASWNLNTNIFEAWGGISIQFKPKPREQQTAEDSAKAEASSPSANATQSPPQNNQ